MPGSGNAYRTLLRLPKDPPTLPKQDGSGGTFNFQLRPAFWFGMALCDTQSFPNPGASCTPDSDTNIFTSTDVNDPHYIGKHPGAAFMELQFYPPGWVPQFNWVSCDPTKWCAALTIDSLPETPTQFNNDACLNVVGEEPVNFAYVTKSGKPDQPPNPVSVVSPGFGTPNPATDLFMNAGDLLHLDLFDTADGLHINIADITTGEAGSMIASKHNGFGQIKFDPKGNGCTVIPYNFHPMYSTSSTRTRVPWAAHSYNVAFSDEIGHFENCRKINATDRSCASSGDDKPDAFGDDAGCFFANEALRVHINGCTGLDDDFDGVSYQHTWPGSLANQSEDRRRNPEPVLFTSPRFWPDSKAPAGETRNYSRVAFETDLPAIEFATNPPCDRSTGANCTNPPQGANFYPIFTTRNVVGQCIWQLGGANIPGTDQTFGGTATAEYGSLLRLTYPGTNGTVRAFNDYRQILDNNPCQTQNLNTLSTQDLPGN